MTILTRRQALRVLSATTVGLPFFVRLTQAQVTSLARDANARLAGGAGYRRRTLTEHQNAIVTVMAEIIIPETDTPGAAAARVNDFIDLILTDWFDPGETESFLAGIDSVDAHAISEYGANFNDCSQEQRVEIIAGLDSALIEAVEDQDSDRPANTLFFYQFKRLTLTGYYTSEAGMTEELNWKVIPGAYRACEPLEDLRRG